MFRTLSRRPSGRRFHRMATLAALAAATILSLAASCSELRALGVPAEDLRAMLARGEAGILLEVPEARYRELGRLGPGAFHYAARLAEKLGSPERSLTLLRLAFAREEGLHRARAGALLLERLEKAEAHAELLRVAEGLREDGRFDALVLRARIGALAGLEKRKEALAAIDEARSLIPSLNGDPRLLLSEADLRLATGDRVGGIEALKAAAASRLADAAVLARLSELASGPGTGGLDAREALALELRLAVAKTDYGAAVRLAQAAKDELARPESGEVLLSDLGRAYLYAREYELGESFFAALEAKASIALASTDSSMQLRDSALLSRYLSAFYPARYLRGRERWAEAAKAFAAALPLARDPADVDACLWYRIDSLAKVSRLQAALALTEAAPRIHDPAGFADIVESLVLSALPARDGATLLQLWEGFGARASANTRIRLGWTVARAAEAGMLPGLGDAAARKAFAEARYRQIAVAYPEPYYRAAAAGALGINAWDFDAAPTTGATGGTTVPAGSATLEPAPSSSRIEDVASAPVEAIGEAEAYLAGFAAYGMSELVMPEFRLMTEPVPALALRRIALSLAESGAYSESMLLAGRLFGRADYQPSREDWQLVWPRPFAEDIAKAAASAGTHERFIYGLVRSESFFRPAVVSSAGAIGLSQLMPATAAETAKAMRLESYDLRSASDNLAIGARHLSGLIRALDGDLLRAAAAYNAGLSRPRTWDRQFGFLPPELWLEAIPFAETRQYARNVLGAAALYGALYEDMNPGRLLFEMLGID